MSNLFLRARIRARKEKMLNVSNLNIAINAHPIIEELSLDVGGGESVALMGPSGCGKTTVLKAIAGFLPTIHKGTIINDGAVWQNAHKNFVGPRMRNTTLHFQELAIWPHLTVRQQLNLVSPKLGSLQVQPDTQEIIEELMLNHRCDTQARHLSGGEKQRLALGRSLRTAAGTLLLDEPFNALDKDKKRQTINFLLRLQKTGRFGIIIATHDPIEAEQLIAPIHRLKAL